MLLGQSQGERMVAWCGGDSKVERSRHAWIGLRANLIGLSKQKRRIEDDYQVFGLRMVDNGGCVQG